MRIMLDAGHGNEPGAAGNGLVEADLTGQIVNIIEKQLAGYEVEVLKTSRGTLSDRCTEANKAKADFFLSVHINASGTGKGTGYETFIHPDAGIKTREYGEAVHRIMADFYKEHGFSDRGLKEKNLQVLRDTVMPAVLVENLFIDNPRDAEFLKSNLHAVGNELAYAVAKALKLKKKQKECCPDCKRILQEVDMVIRGLKAVLDKYGYNHAWK